MIHLADTILESPDDIHIRRKGSPDDAEFEVKWISGYWNSNNAHSFCVFPKGAATTKQAGVFHQKLIFGLLGPDYHDSVYDGSDDEYAREGWNKHSPNYSKIVTVGTLPPEEVILRAAQVGPNGPRDSSIPDIRRSYFPLIGRLWLVPDSPNVVEVISVWESKSELKKHWGWMSRVVEAAGWMISTNTYLECSDMQAVQFSEWNGDAPQEPRAQHYDPSRAHTLDPVAKQKARAQGQIPGKTDADMYAPQRRDGLTMDQRFRQHVGDSLDSILTDPARSGQTLN